MKSRVLLTVIAAGVASTASADVISETNSAIIEWGTQGTGLVTDGPALLFPSDISVAGASGPISDVNITLNDGAHTWADDMEIVLVSPAGTAVMVMADAGGNDNIAGSITFDDQAAGPIGDTGQGANDDLDFSGSFQTSVYGTTFATTAPATSGTLLSLFNGEDANGTWSLYVYDDAGGDTGAFSGGWTLDIVTVPAPASAALLGLGGLAAARRRR
ncbi:MAG: hypothetical protein Phyf2KO_24790 [Phycisphaerales bacterium]